MTEQPFAMRNLEESIADTTIIELAMFLRESAGDYFAQGNSAMAHKMMRFSGALAVLDNLAFDAGHFKTERDRFKGLLEQILDRWNDETDWDDFGRASAVVIIAYKEFYR